ncbi:MAG: hypothetical protein ACRD3Q_05620 [Terriglobales bacterium]
MAYSFSNFSDFRNAKLTCPDCGWVGQGRQTRAGNTFDYCAEFLCPVCGHGGGKNHDYLAVANFPKPGELWE